MIAQSYDDIPYESNALKQTHPLHLYQLASYYGFNPTPIENARVLELGCASGGNIIPMAFHFPSTLFTGLDLSAKQIKQGNQWIYDLQLKNIALRCMSIEDFHDNEKFDYIICHGLYSWVDEPVRDKILQICHDNLSDKGVAYISYNTFPGWVIGNTLRDLILFATKDRRWLEDKINQIDSLFAIYQEGLTQTHTEYSWLLNEELKIVSEHSVNQLVHEHLSENHCPLYFYQFIEQAQRFHLNYIGDATFFDEGEDIAERQNNDFIQNRRFRSSLLCHAVHEKHDSSQHENIKQYYQQYLALSDNKFPTVSEKPHASLLARYQSQLQQHVTNYFHENILLTPVAQALMPFLDGQHDLPALCQIIKKLIIEGTLEIVDKNLQPISNESEIEENTIKICQEALYLLAARALLD
jgi:2-polyprenyl-3-methyl-5-hydroxy-6-metoxy-1,4-benzoquinol methylase